MALKKLNNKHLKAIQLLVYSDKLKGDIAEEVGVSRTTLSTWLNEDVFQEGIRAEMHRGFSEMALKARKRLDNLVDDTNSQVALAAAKEVLNKAGYQETTKLEQDIKGADIKVLIVE